jgi:rubrerythrin
LRITDIFAKYAERRPGPGGPAAEGKTMSYSLPEFLAHAIAMEDEAAERYLELADMMEAHNNLEVSKLFRQMNHYSILHRDSIKKRAASVELPKLRMADFRWVTPPEVADEEAFDYTLDPFHALQYARENEQRAAQFYQSVADDAQDDEVKRLAAEFAEEEQEHTAALDKMIESTPPSR